MHPALIRNAIDERPQTFAPEAARTVVGLERRTVKLVMDPKTRRIGGLSRRTFSDVYGDRTEEVRFEAWPASKEDSNPGRVVVLAGKREVARFDFAPATLGVTIDSVPAGERQRDKARAVADSEIELREIAPHSSRSISHP